METYLLPHHKCVFRQAYRTPFTVHPCQTLIIENGPTQFLSKFERKEIKTKQFKEFNFTKDILKWLTPNHKYPPKLKYNLTMQQVKRGYNIWPEKASTAPEGRYLSLYNV
eukprot:9948178-Ditylum_brightwellii.AAC.1